MTAYDLALANPPEMDLPEDAQTCIHGEPDERVCPDCRDEDRSLARAAWRESW